MGMDDEVNHYVILGLPSGEQGAKLSEEEIKKAYRSKLLVLHPDKRPDDPNAHHNFLNLHTAYKILIDKKTRQSFHQHDKENMIKSTRRRKSQQQNSDSSKCRKTTDIDQREQAARAAYSAAKQARDMEEYIRTSDEQLIARIKRHAASKAPPAAAPSTLNKRGAKDASSTQCPCGHCQGAHCLDREFSSNFNCGAGFEAYQNSLLSKFRTKDLNDIPKHQDL